MADRYWVGGTANWDGTAGTKWALTSGGLGGQAVPTSADDVFFDGSSTGTCTISSGNTGAKSINCTGFTGTLTGTATISVSGSVTLVAGMTFTYSSTLTINATSTLTSAGKSFAAIIFNASGATFTLADALTLTSGLTLTQGTFDAANFNVTASTFNSSNSNTRTLTMGSGTWTITGSGTSAWTCSISTNLTLNANTSTITMTSASSKTFSGGSKTYYNLNHGGPGTLTISGSNSFNDFTTSTTTSTIRWTSGTTQTFTNFTFSNTAPDSTFFTSVTAGSTYTLSKSSGTVNVSRLLIQDSIATGGATWNATDSVDNGNNTGWNITASTGRYWVGGTANWDGTAGSKWATSSGGLGGATVPGSVDPAYFDAASGANTVTVSASGNCAGIICTGFTGTLTGSSDLVLNGNLTLVAGMTYSYTGIMSLQSTATITSAGKTLSSTSCIGTLKTYTLGDACTLGTTNTFTLTFGTLDLNGNTLSTGIFSSDNNNTRAITFGSANIALTSTTAATTVLLMAGAFNFTMTTSGGGFTRNMAATATVQFGSTSGGSTSNAPNLTVNAGASTLTITSGSYFKNVVFTGSTSSVTASGLNMAGNLTLASGGIYTAVVPTFLASGTITSVGKQIGNTTVNGSGITITLGDACTLGTTNTFTLTVGTLNLNGNTLSTGIFASSNSNNRAITFGSANIALTSTVAATTVLSMATANSFTMTTSGGAFTRNMAATATVNFGATAGGTTSNAPNLTVNAGSSALTITTNSYFKNVNFTGYTGTPTATYNAAGDLTLSTGGTYTSVVPTFRASGTLTSTGKTLGNNTTINGSGITVTLGDAATLANTSSFVLTQGTLDLNGNTLSTGIFSSDNSNTRSIAFGSTNIALTENAAAVATLNISTATNFTMTTSGGGFARNNTVNSSVYFGSTAGGTVSNAPNLFVTAGASFITFGQVFTLSYFKNMDFTGSTTAPSTNCFVCGNVTLASGGVYYNWNPTFIASGTLTSNSGIFQNMVINGSGITLTLADAARSSSLTLTNGTLNLAGFTYTGYFITGVGTKNLTFNGGTMSITQSGTSWDNANPTGFTTTAGTGTGIISMTSAFAKTFNGGGSTYNCTLNQGGAGALTISGSNTFNNITNSTQPATVTFTAGTTQTFTNFSLSGTAGNLITINSTSAGSQATLSKASGTVNVNYLSIQDSNATGGAAWYAANSTDVSNNTGWIFLPPANGNFFMFLS